MITVYFNERATDRMNDDVCIRLYICNFKSQITFITFNYIHFVFDKWENVFFHRYVDVKGIRNCEACADNAEYCFTSS